MNNASLLEKSTSLQIPAYSRLVITGILFLLCLMSPVQLVAQNMDSALEQVIADLSSYSSRRTGTEGYEKAAAYIEEYFEQLGLETGIFRYPVPVRQFNHAQLRFEGGTAPLTPFHYNAITPEAIDGQIEGPLYYVSQGTLPELDHKQIEGAIILMDFDSGQNWQHLAALGAKALIYIDHERTRGKHFFTEKQELSPIQFPCFWMEKSTAVHLFGEHFLKTPGHVSDKVTLTSSISWHEVIAKNIFCIIPGKDPELKKELLILEAFYDSTELVAGRSPGADEAASIANLLVTAQHFAENPPGRTVMLLATSGHMQTLAGMRDILWSMNTKSKELRKYKKQLKHHIEDAESNLQVLTDLTFPLKPDKTRDQRISPAIKNRLKLSVDTLSRDLMQLRLKQVEQEHQEKIDTLVRDRFSYRKLGWAESYHNLSSAEQKLFENILPDAAKENKRKIKNSKKHLNALKSALDFRKIINEFEIAAIISLHLSSHGNGIGGFHRGWLYSLKPNINRTGIYSRISEKLHHFAEQYSGKVQYIDSLRPTQMRSWDSWFPDKPFLGGEVSSLAGYLGLSLVTVGDGRELWGTPWDTKENINWPWLQDQAGLLRDLTHRISWEAILQTGKLPKNGFSTVTGRANLLLQGELFADFPADKTTLLAYQGFGKFYATVGSNGYFRIKGIANKKNVFDKLIIEGYRFKEDSGKVIWAIDKKETGKANYRLKIRRNNMKTDLILFSCNETTIFDLLEPRNFQYLTKMHLLDGRRDAPPQHYWYSRIDTRASTISSIYLEPGTWLKLTLSDTVITRKFLLSNGSPENPMGFGYPVDRHPSIPNTVYHAANDAWSLLSPRISNLEAHGIYDERINLLQKRGLEALDKSNTHLSNLNYSKFREESSEALALAARVYTQVEKTQKDVLFGVLFYIALFVPFAFCMERFLFNYANIYKRIVAFTLLLLILIAVIYKAHPAFQLAYSPMVVILAFFIIGLSLMVTLIIFFRFEEEMILLQRQSTHKRPAEISHWKAFVAAFFLGVSNLRRRRIRTILTCLTLVILTFTIMSFTTVKSNQKHNRIPFQKKSQYNGLLLKTVNWNSLPRQATDIITGHMEELSKPAPRVWLESSKVSQPVHIPITRGKNTAEIQGLVGLSPNERFVTGIDKILTSGRWFTRDDKQALLLEEKMAQQLGMDDNTVKQVSLWGMPFTVIGTFSASLLEDAVDLDGEPLTPVTFPEEASRDVSEVEQEAMESGDDIRSFQSRYRHIPASQTAFIPAQTLLALGGNLKSVAIKPEANTNTNTLAKQLVDRFSLSIFAGEKDGVWLYSPSNTMQYSGVPNIIIPLLISICIVLNTMISSVYERKNEIAVYTSVGLAPSHVSFLFVAEALALAVISVVLGYLVAQVSAAFLSTTTYWQGITVNYSSLSGVAAMLLVIIVVLVSVIYPSRVAAKIAIPDVKRSFQLPKPIDNTISVTLPFYMKYEEHESIGGFIFNYLSGHQDISHGLFSTGPVNLVFSCATVAEIKQMILHAENPSDLHCMHIRSKVWLAPFDFGIMQEVDIQFCPAVQSDKYLEIQITLERQAGEMGMWQRINTSFLHDIRKQLLVWRSLDEEAHEQFRNKLREAMNNKNSLQ